MAIDADMETSRKTNAAMARGVAGLDLAGFIFSLLDAVYAGWGSIWRS